MNEIDKTVTINLIVYLQSEKYSNSYRFQNTEQ